MKIVDKDGMPVWYGDSEARAVRWWRLEGAPDDQLEISADNHVNMDWLADTLRLDDD